MSSTQLTGHDPAEVLGSLGESACVLILSPDKQYDSEVCGALLSAAAPQNANYLSVTLDSTPDERIDEWRTNVGELPSETGIIAVGEMTRSTATMAPSQNQHMSPVQVDTVSDPSDLTGLAISIGTFLDAWADTERTPVFCFHSISSLLLHTEKNRLFRFLHSMVGRLREADAMAHFHLNPLAYDEGTVNLLSGLFDAVVDVHEDGSVTVRKRR